MPPPWFVDERCRDLKIVSSFEALAVNATSPSVIVGSQVVPNSDAENLPNSCNLQQDCKQNHMVRAGVYFFFLLDERREHKADYVPCSKTACKGQKSRPGKGLCRVVARGYGRGWGRGIGLKSRINLKIGTKNGLRGRAGFGLMEARFYRHSMGWQSASRHGKSLRV